MLQRWAAIGIQTVSVARHAVRLSVMSRLSLRAMTHIVKNVTSQVLLQYVRHVNRQSLG